MNVLCTDNRFELIAKYKNELIEGTNIETSEEEMKVIDTILFRFWQMGWLDKLEEPQLIRCKDCKYRGKMPCPFGIRRMPRDNDFCFYGKRREE